MFVSREILDKALEAVDIKLRALEKFQSNLEGRMWAGAGLLVLLQLVLFWLKK